MAPAVTGAAGAEHEEQVELLRWGERERRDLPWRHTRDPWAVLVAEVMAQQTQVERVVPAWRDLLRRWPDPAAMASAPLSEVLGAWHGLGYPRRARHLWEAARRLTELHDGRVPTEVAELLELPGVGPYTARAVRAFAHELDAAVVDTNVGRVLARRAGRRLTPREAQAAADDWLPAGRAWEWNQTLLDLGALRCRPRDPDCDGCPVARGCAWAVAGRPEPDPAAGSAGVSRRQARFEGSRRQARGRLLRAATAAPLPPQRWVEVAGWGDRPDAEVAVGEVARSLVADGLAALDPQGCLVPPD